jgi:hypothetical protein
MAEQCGIIFGKIAICKETEGLKPSSKIPSQNLDPGF